MAASLPRLQVIYRDEIVKKMMKECDYSSPMEVPVLTKITLSMGLGGDVDKKVMAAALADMEKIAGQKPIATHARKSIAGFKIREGQQIGCKVTLRRNRMYEFLDRLVNIALPRVRDFRGLSVNAFDGRGNYSLGTKEQIIFPEIEYDKIDMIRGMNITITIKADSDKEAEMLLKAFNFPFKDSLKTKQSVEKA